MPQRLIDVPIESLPHIDERLVEIEATTQEIWRALVETVDEAGGGWAARRTAAALGCLAGERSGEPGEIGSTIPGFIVTRSVPPAVLALMGEHRFSRYALVFRIGEQIGGPPLLSAETRAEFPGVTGSAYRLAVVGSRGHRLVTGHLIGSIRKRAERAGEP